MLLTQLCRRSMSLHIGKRRRFLSVSRPSSGIATGRTYDAKKLSPSEAGRKAYELAQELKKKKAPARSIETIMAHAGLNHNGKALSPPLELASTFERPPDGDYQSSDFLSNAGEEGFIYGRMGNPTRNSLERTMAEIEAGVDETTGVLNGACTAYSSGMAAVSSIVLAHPKCLVLIPDDCYHGVPSQLITVLAFHGITFKTIDMNDAESVRSHLRDAILYQKRQESQEKYRQQNIDNFPDGSIEDGSLMDEFGIILWIESPSNPLAKVTDIAEMVRISRDVSFNATSTGITVVVDSTWSPPNVTQPLKLGADVSIHSATKYLGGHSDVVLGVATVSLLSETGLRLSSVLKSIQQSIGSVASPFDCWLTLRGIRSLRVRVRRAMKTALKIAQFLDNHPNVQKTHYPGLESHSGHLVAKQQMKGGFGAMLSFEVENEAMAMAVAGAVQIFRRATSLGGTESLIEHRFSIEPEGRKVSHPALLRVSVGLEDARDLIEDLDNALNIAKVVCP